MTPLNFVYWLQGCIELGCKTFDEHQVRVIRDHLELVLKKETPQREPYKISTPDREALRKLFGETGFPKPAVTLCAAHDDTYKTSSR